MAISTRLKVSHRTDSEIKDPALASAGSRAIPPREIKVAKCRSINTSRTTAIKVNFRIDFSSSTTAWPPNMRLNPATGLSLDIFGRTASHEKRKPPVAPEAKIATTMVTSMSGSTSKKP